MSPHILREGKNFRLWRRLLLLLALLTLGLFVASVLLAGGSQTIEWELIQTSSVVNRQ